MRANSVATLAAAAWIALCSATGISQSNGGSAGEPGGLPEIANGSLMGSKDRPMRVSAGVMAAQILHKEDPIYPADTKASGAVVMAATIDREGKVDTLKVISGPDVLRDPALTAVRQWTYKPYLLNGRPVFVQTTVTVNFTPVR
jgi:periplasmic protein TonB